MRAKEFISEAKRGKPLDAQAKAIPSASYYVGKYEDLYRSTLMMARLPADVSDIDPYSFVTGRPMLIAYTKEEQDLIRQAFKEMGIEYHEHFNDNESVEPDAVNNESPMQGFKGY